MPAVTESLGRISKASIPFMAAAAIFAPNASAGASKGEAAHRAPTAKRVAYCMKQILKRPLDVSTRVELDGDQGIGGFGPLFTAGVKVKAVKDRKGVHCTDVAERSVQPQLRLNEEPLAGTGVVVLEGNLTDSMSASVSAGVASEQCIDGLVVGRGVAVVEADPVDPSMATRSRTYRAPAITASC